MFVGIAMWISLLFLCSWIHISNPQWLRRIVGAGLLADIVVHIILQSLFSGTGSERVSMLFAGVLFNLTMHAYRWACGYEKLTVKGWLRFAGRFTPTEKVKPIKRTRTARSEHVENRQCR